MKVKSRPERQTDQGRNHNEFHREHNLAGLQYPVPGSRVNDGGAAESAEQRVRRTGGQPGVPRDEIPHNRAQQTREDDLDRHVIRVHPGGDGIGDVHPEKPYGRKVPPRRPDHGLRRAQHAGANDRGDRVGRVVEPVDEIKHERREKNHGNIRILNDVKQVGKERGHSDLLSSPLSSS